MISLILAIMIPCLAFMLMIPVPQAPRWPCPPPFGWELLLFFHVACGLPLAWLVAGKLPAIPPVVSMGSGVALATLTVVAGAVAGPFLPESGYWERLTARVAWVFALQFPWATMAGPRMRMHTGWLCASLLLAVLPPALYSRELARESLARIPSLIAEERIRETARQLFSLAAAGFTMPSGESARSAANGIQMEIKRLENEMRDPAPLPRALAQTRLELNREALETLEAAPAGLQRDRLSGLVWQRLGRPELSNIALEKALENSTGSSKLEIIDLMARNHHDSGAHAEAERLYQRQFDSLPEFRGYLSMQLARHYHSGNRLPEALHWLQTAREIDPATNRAEADSLLSEIIRATPGCLLAPFYRQGGQP